MQPIQDRSYRATCEANFCHANVGVGDGRRSLSNVKNLGSLDLQVLGSGTHSDLSVNDAAMGYQLNFSANGQRGQVCNVACLTQAKSVFLQYSRVPGHRNQGF